MSLITDNIKRLFLVCLGDMLTYAMFTPLLVPLFSGGIIGIQMVPEHFKYILLGSYFSTYSFFQVFTVPLWARFAQKTSKKWVLQISYFGNALSYLISAMGLYWQSIILLFIGVVIAGLTCANMAMINAMISEQVPEKKWSQHYSLFGAGIGAAFIVGPQITSFCFKIAPAGVTPWFISLLCVCIALFNGFFAGKILEPLKESSTYKDTAHQKKHHSKIKLLSLSFIKKLSRKTLALLLLVFCVYFSWFFFIKFFQVHAIEQLSLNAEHSCHLSSLLGLSCTLWQGLRSWKGWNWMDSPWALVGGALIMALGIFAYFSCESLVLSVCLIIMLAFSYAMMIPSLLSLLLKHQNFGAELMSAIYQSVQSVAKIFAPIISGVLISWHHMLSAWFCVGLLFIGIIVLAFGFRQPPGSPLEGYPPESGLR